MSIHTYPFLFTLFPFLLLCLTIQSKSQIQTSEKRELSLDECWDICYDMAQQFGYAEVVFYALNGNRVVQGSYTDQD